MALVLCVLWPCGLPTHSIIFLNETPRFLIKKGRIDEAKVALGRIHQNGVEEELQEIAGSIEREGQGKWKRLSRSPLLVDNIASLFLQRVIGLDFIVFFGPFFLQSIGYSYHASFLAPLIASIIRTGVATVTYSIYTFFGRRRTLVSTCLGMFLIQVCLLGLFLSRGDAIYHLSRQNSDIAISFAIPLIACYSLLSGPASWTQASYPEGTTLLGASLEMTTSLFMTLVMYPTILWLLCVMEAWIFAFFATSVLCVGCLIYKFLPEKPKKRMANQQKKISGRATGFGRDFFLKMAELIQCRSELSLRKQSTGLDASWPWKMIRKNLAPPKVTFFGWLAAYGTYFTQENLQIRGYVF